MVDSSFAVLIFPFRFPPRCALSPTLFDVSQTAAKWFHLLHLKHCFLKAGHQACRSWTRPHLLHLPEFGMESCCGEIIWSQVSGGEFTSNEFEDYQKSEGVKHEIAVPKTHDLQCLSYIATAMQKF